MLITPSQLLEVDGSKSAPMDYATLLTQDAGWSMKDVAREDEGQGQGPSQRSLISKGVRRVIVEYGDVLRKLSEE